MTDAEDLTEDEQLDSNALSQAMAVASTYKILGQLTDSSGVGVLGQNDAESGTPIGVQGSVPNASDGYGLYTDDDVGVFGDIRTVGSLNVVVNSDIVAQIRRNQSSGAAGEVRFGHSENQAFSDGVTVSGGGFNDGNVSDHHYVGSNADFTTIGGGRNNDVNVYASPNSAEAATIAGGRDNEINEGTCATIPGGSSNVASGDYSFAAGRRAKATENGSFVWADSTDADVTSSATDQFLVEAAGGVGLGTTSPEAPLSLRSENKWDLDNNEGDLRIGDNGYRFNLGVATGGGGAGTVNLRAKGGAKTLSLGSGNSNIMAIREPDGVFPRTDDTYSLGKSGNRWSAVYATNGTIQTSDARLKTNVADLDGGLEQVRALRPVSYEWDVGTDETQADAETRLGLLAQEVRDVVPEAVVEPEDPDAPLGVDYDMLIPVLLDAVDEQQDEIESLQAENETLRETLGAKEDRIETLESEAEQLRERLATLEERVTTIDTGGTPSPADD